MSAAPAPAQGTRLDVRSLRASFAGPHDVLRVSDGKELFLRRWEPTGEPPTSVLVLPGITAYSGPYGPLLAEQLARAGHRVWGFDMRGHGLSDGKRGDYPSRARFEGDLAETVDFVRARSKRLVVLGHSLGALSAVVAQRVRPEKVDALVLLSAARRIRTGIYPRPKGAAVLKALLGAALFRGWPVIEYRRAGMSGTGDPLFVFRYSARFYSVLYGTGVLRLTSQLQSGVLDARNLDFTQPLAVPVLVGVGDQDELFPVEYVREFYESIPAKDKRFVTVPGARHALFPPGSAAPLEAWLLDKFGSSLG